MAKIPVNPNPASNPVQSSVLNPASGPSPAKKPRRKKAYPLKGEWGWTKHGPFGWYSLNSFLCVEIGDRLTYWSKHGMSYPERADPTTGKPWTPENWALELGRHGAALTEYARIYDDGKPEEFEPALEAARIALAFLAENLDTLWD